MKNSVVLSGRVGRFEKAQTSSGSVYYKISVAQSVEAFDSEGRRLPSQTEWYNLIAFDGVDMDDVDKGDEVVVKGSLGNYRRAGEQYSSLTVRVKSIKLLKAVERKVEVKAEADDEVPF